MAFKRIALNMCTNIELYYKSSVSYENIYKSIYHN